MSMTCRFQDTEVEIGFGASPVFIPLAARQPETLFIGLDVNEEWCRRAVKESNNLALDNAEVINCEAKHFLAQLAGVELISAFHVYFPSPGPRDMRVLTRDSVTDIRRLLRPLGSIRVVTDSTEYMHDIERLFSTDDWIMIKWGPPKLPIPAGLIVGTDCEIRYGAKYRMHAIRRR
jgi:tRNA G46 methylase TrmB